MYIYFELDGIDTKNTFAWIKELIWRERIQGKLVLQKSQELFCQERFGLLGSVSYRFGLYFLKDVEKNPKIHLVVHVQVADGYSWIIYSSKILTQNIFFEYQNGYIITYESLYSIELTSIASQTYVCYIVADLSKNIWSTMTSMLLKNWRRMNYGIKRIEEFKKNRFIVLHYFSTLGGVILRISCCRCT